MIFEHKATPAEYSTGLKLAIERGWLTLDRPGNLRDVHTGRCGVVCVMAITSKVTIRYSWAAERELIKMAKTMDMQAIVEKTGRSPESIMKVATRLGIKIKGRK